MKQGKRRLMAIGLATAIAAAGLATFVATGTGDDGNVNELGGTWGEPKVVPSEVVGPGVAAAAGVRAEAAARRIVLKVVYRSARNPIPVTPAGQEGSAVSIRIKCKGREKPLSGGFATSGPGLAEGLSAPRGKSWTTGVFNVTAGAIDFTPLAVCAKFKR